MYLRLLFILPALLVSHAAAQPQIRLSTGQLPGFREVVAGHFSDVQFYYVSAAELDDTLLLTAEAPFRLSLDCYEGFAETLSLPPAGGEVPSTRIYVRLFAESPGQWEATAGHSSAGADAAELELSGKVISTHIPPGYYESATGSGSELKTLLHQLIRDHQVQTYASLWEHFTTTDATFDGHVWDIYSDTPCEEPPYLYVFGEDQDRGFGGTQEGEFYNREHSMPRSWFGGAVDPMNTDLFHIFPVDKFVNAQRDNHPFGEVEAPVWTSMNGGRLGPNSFGQDAGTAFEPVDEYKGDLARAFLYMITRYEDLISGWDSSPEGNRMLGHTTYPGYAPWAIDMLLKWHRLDPVSQKERVRNQEVYRIQGNRNPFVDHPEWVELIWGEHTGLKPGGGQGMMRAWPNPVRDVLHVAIVGDTGASAEVSLLNMQGHTLRKQAHLPGKEGKIQICMQGLPAGLYLLKARSGKSFQTQKIVRPH